jgi:hypothetical protein
MRSLSLALVWEGEVVRCHVETATRTKWCATDGYVACGRERRGTRQAAADDMLQASRRQAAWPENHGVALAATMVQRSRQLQRVSGEACSN